MTKAIKFIRLDFITVKPFLTYRNLLLFLGVALIMIFTSGSAETAIGILMMYATIYAAYPFSVGDKSNIDALYITLSINRSAVVIGRYLYALVMNVLSGIAAYLFCYVALTVTRKGFDAAGSLYAVLVILFVYSVIQAVQLPIYFKLGYNKAKFIAYMPLVAFPLTIMAISGFLKDFISLEQIDAALEWAAANPAIIAAAGVCVWLIIMIISVRASLAFYKKRDF
jgi:hypothetical protein